jgi:S1-C subfamily serine protease
VEIAELNDDNAEDFGYEKRTHGVIVTRVQPNSVAFESGLRRGMLVTKVENQKVSTVAAARQALENASLSRGVVLQVQSPQAGTGFVLLKDETTSE